MINVTLYRNANKEMVGFEVVGHASYAPYGQDVVCAGVSALTIATANGLMAQKVGLDKLAENDGKIVLYLSDDLSELSQIRAQAILETFALGMTEIAKEYNKSYISIHTKIR